MNILAVIAVLVIVGVLLWAMDSIIPMNPQIRKIIQVVVIIVVILWLLQVFGILSGVGRINLRG